MLKKLKGYAIYSSAALIAAFGVVASTLLAHATDTSPLGVNTAFGGTGGFTATIGSIITTNLPLVLAIAAGLIGLGILVHYVRRRVGRK